MKSQIATAVTAFLLAGTAACFPAIPRTFQPLRTRNATDSEQLAQRIAQVKPETAACDLAATPDCRTNVQLAPFLARSLEAYGTTEAGQVAAVVALTAFETDGYRYKHNVYPGRPGQGTSNMQMFDFNLLYAQSIPALAAPLAAIGAVATDPQRDQVLALVTPDEYNFGSGPWFLTTQCAPTVAADPASGSDAAFAAYMACIGTSLTAERQDYWVRAKTAFGVY